MYNYDFYRGNYNYVNNNYNIPNYEQNVNNNNTFDPYNGLIRGNLFPDLYNSYKVDKPYEIKPMNEQAEMLTYIDAFKFACVDLSLYLDVFPEDKEALNLFNMYRTNLNEYMESYQSKYGPICKTSDAMNAYPWSWNNSPWPWEKGV